MNDEQMRVAIAERCGWYHRVQTSQIDHKTVIDAWEPPGQMKLVASCPDYPNDLNAMHEAAMSLRVKSPLQYVKYTAAITQMVAKFNSDIEDALSISAHDATARQRAEAFLRTVGKWKEDA